MLGEIEGRRRRGRQRMRWLDGITDSMMMPDEQALEMVEDEGASVLQSMGSQRVGHNRATEQHQKLEIKEVPSSWRVDSIRYLLPCNNYPPPPELRGCCL